MTALEASYFLLQNSEETALSLATMPATAGRVRMPANNRQSTSASLNTHSIWQNAIGCEPA